MKKSLTKIKLINWHGFYNQTIDVKGSMLVFGENGSGKSTLLDALMFLLTGGEEKFFNSAANDRASRTVETYMRAKIGIEGKENLRNQPSVISHICTEWYDEYSKKPFIIGVCLEIQEEKGKVERSFYYMENQSIDDSLFTNNINGNLQTLGFRLMSEKHGDKLRKIEGRREDIRMKLYSLLSLEGKRYYELLPKAIAFRPIKDVNQFVYQFLMPDKAVDLTNMKRNILVYNELQKRVEEDIKKEDALSDITHLGDIYSELKKQNELLKAYELKHEIDDAAGEVDKVNATIEKNKKLIVEYLEDADHFANQIREIDQSIATLTSEGAAGEFKRLTDLIKEKSSLENEYLSRAKHWNELLKKEAEIASSLGIKNKLSKFLSSTDMASFLDEAKRYHEALLSSRNEIAEKIVQNDIKLSTVSSEERDLVSRKNLLSKGMASYDNNVTNLIEVIESGLKEIYHEDIKAIPFCELLEMVPGEESWRNAVEGYLNTRRFDLFVPERYFDDALRLYERNKNRLQIFGVGLVNVAKLKDIEPMEDSLALKVKAISEDARKYASYIMGNIICVDNEDELKSYESSITRTVMVYKNKAARQTKQKIYETPYIGYNASNIQLETVQEAIEAKEKEYRALLDEKSRLEALRSNGCDRSQIQLLLNDKNWWAKYNETKEYVESLKEKAGKVEKMLDNENHRPIELEKEKEEIQKKRDERLAEKSRLEATNEYLQKSITETLSRREESDTRFKDFLSDPALREEFAAFEKNNDLTLSQINAKIKENNEEIQTKRARLINAMQNYVTTFHFDATASMDSLPSFYQELNILMSRALVEDKEKLERAKLEATSTFENNYLEAIRANINSEEEHIRELNKLLADKPFGTDGDTYRFIVTKSKDKMFGDYYDIFKSDENFTQNDLFTENLSDRNQALMNDLFHKLTSDKDDERTLQEISKFCDYRRFMNYDIEITNKNGRSLFSKISREKSGGETQTPFYVIIAASFDQIIRSSPDRRSHGCVIMLDEAFNNMDTGHIEGIMQYFEQLEIQPVIAVPTERGKIIARYVETNILTIKVNNVIEARPFISLEEDNEKPEFLDESLEEDQNEETSTKE